MATVGRCNYVTPENKEVLQPYLYHGEIPGERLRGFMSEWAELLFGKVDNQEEINDLLFHLAQTALILDDIQDNAVLRNGKPAAHKVYGIPKVLNCIRYMTTTLILEKALEFNSPKITQLVLDILVEGFAGQGMELYWRDNFVCPTEEEYCSMVRKKTGCFVRLAFHLQTLKNDEANRNVEEFVFVLADYIQIQDDYLNLINATYHDYKGFCTDITEGKFSFPIIHAIRNCPKEGAIIKDILSKRTEDIELKKQCFELLQQCGSLEYTKQKMTKLKADLIKLLEPLGPDISQRVSHALEEVAQVHYFSGGGV